MFSVDPFTARECLVSSTPEREDRKAKQKTEGDDIEVVRKADVTPATEVANLPHADNPVDEASEESFPASDPPSYSGRKEREDEAR
jgi:hypothetical protein